LKIAVIGGGSTYTPELFEGLLQRQAELGLTDVVLEDIDADRLGPVAGFCRRMADAAGSPVRVTDTLDLDDALEGAAFVVTQIRVGGQRARHRDETVPMRHGCIGQETTGAGGFAKAVRTIPVLLDIAQHVRRHAPGAWVINFANPSGIVTEALLRLGGVPAIGLCNIPTEMRMEAAKALGAPPESVELDYFGLNHLGWIRGMRVGGVDVFEHVLAAFTGEGGPANIPQIDVGADVVAAMRAIPTWYLRYYYSTEAVLQELAGQPKTRAEVVMDLEDRLFAIYRDPTQHDKPALLGERGGSFYSRAAIDVMAGLLSPIPRIEIVNTLNQGAIPGIPDDASVEIPAELSAHGVRPLPQETVPEEMFGLMRQVKAYERLTIEAATSRSRHKALAALIANPLVRTAEKSRAILADIIANGDFDPVD
jgi:6-phospho-beta-glucosidase